MQQDQIGRFRRPREPIGRRRLAGHPRYVAQFCRVREVVIEDLPFGAEQVIDQGELDIEALALLRLVSGPDDVAADADSERSCRGQVDVGNAAIDEGDRPALLLRARIREGDSESRRIMSF